MEILPILRELTDEQFESLLSICIKKELPALTVIFEEGNQSEDMYILTEGSLKVLFGGKRVGEIYPVSTVGEMGVFTGEPRSARVITVTKCTLLRIMKNDLFEVLEKDKDFYIKFQKVMFQDVAYKLRMTNETIAKLNRYISKLEKKY